MKYLVSNKSPKNVQGCTRAMEEAFQNKIVSEKDVMGKLLQRTIERQ